MRWISSSMSEALRALRWLTMLLGLSALALAVAGCEGCGGEEILHGHLATALTIDPTTATTPVATTVKFVVTETFDDGMLVNRSDDPNFAPLTWSSSDPSIATVDPDGTARGIKVGNVKITATEPATGLSVSADLTVTDGKLVTLEVTPPTATTPVMTTVTFTATGIYSDGTKKDLTAVVKWSSSDDKIATVAKGVATGVAKGEVTITAEDTTNAAIKGTAKLTVTDATVKEIVVTPPTATAPRGTTQKFIATATYSDGSTKDVSATVKWTSSSATIATIDATGIATGVSVGEVTITATDDVAKLSGTAKLTVTDAKLDTLVVTPPTATLPIAGTQKFTATATYSDGVTKDVSAAVTWSSSDTVVAAVSSTGVATAKAIGVTTIEAKDPVSGLSGKATLTVTGATLTSIAVTPATATVPRTSPRQFIATGTYSDSTTKDLTAVVTWSSSEPTFATISNAAGTQGLASTVTAGTTTITAKDAASGLSGTATLIVTDAVLKSIEITPDAPSVVKGGTVSFKATGVYTDGTRIDLTNSVTWSSSDPTKASISNAAGSKGRATGVDLGTVTITALDPTTSITGSTTLTVTGAVLVSITVEPATLTVPKGIANGYIATAHYSDGSVAIITTSVTWSSSVPSVATVSNVDGSRGLVTSLDVGTSVITARDPVSGLSGTGTIIVTGKKIVSISVSPPTPSVAAGNTVNFSAIATYSDGTAADITSSVTWSSSATVVAIINNVAPDNGVATTKTAGSTSIRATDPATGLFGQTTLTVTAATVVSVAVTPPTATVPAGRTQAYVATATYSDGSTLVVTTSATWSSSNDTAATVGPDGVAKGVTAGMSATLTATFSGKSGTAIINVDAAVLSSIEVLPPNASIPNGTTQQYTARMKYSDGTSIDISDATVSWSSDSPGDADISATGLASTHTLTPPKTVKITATDKVDTSISGSTNLTINGALLTSIVVTPGPTATMPKGTNESFLATGYYSDGTNKDITTEVSWSVDSTGGTSKISINPLTGVATAVDSGTAVKVIATHTLPTVVGSSSVTVTAAVLNKIVITASPLRTTLAKGETEDFTAQGYYTDGTDRDVTTEVNWDSSNTTTATISDSPPDNGRLTAAAVGTTDVSASVGLIKSNIITINVTAAVLVSITIEPAPTVSIPEKLTQTFTAYGHYTDRTDDITALVSSGWSSSATAVATFDLDPDRNRLRAATAGTTNVTATYEGKTSNTVVVTVTTPVVTGITVSPSTATRAISQTEQFSITLTYNNGVVSDPITSDASLTWSISAATPAGAATIDPAGLATAVLAGTATVRASYVAASGTTHVGTAELTITPRTLSVIEINPAGPLTMPRLAGTSLQAFAVYTDGYREEVTDTADWSSSNTSVATVTTGATTGGGDVQTFGAGTTSITATFGGVTGTLSLTVSSAALTAIVVTPNPATVADGGRQQFTATGTYSDGSSWNITNFVSWSSSAPGKLGIGNAPRKRGIGIGKSPGTGIIVSAKLGAITGTGTVTVSSATLTSITINRVPTDTDAIDPTSIPRGTRQFFQAIANYSDGSSSDVTTSMSWSSSAPTVASISNAGKLEGVATGLSAGTTNIRATDPNNTAIFAQVPLTVRVTTMTSITVTPASPTIVKGFSQQMKAVANFADGTKKNVTYEVIWSTDNTAVATVSNVGVSRGFVRGIAAGTTTVRATYPNTTMVGTTTINVIN